MTIMKRVWNNLVWGLVGGALVAGMLFLGGCHHGLGTYRNMDRWMLPAGDDRRPLGGHPREITEYDMRGEDTGDVGKRGLFYVKYGFGADGDLISRDTYLHDTLVMKSAAVFNQEGYQDVTTNVESGQSARTYSRRLSDGRYKTVFVHLKTPSTSTITAFLANGTEVVRDEFEDTAAEGKPTGNANIYYDGNRISKVVGLSGGNTIEELMYYSKWDTPDSIQMYSGKLVRRLLERVYYSMNDHGDPVRLVRMVGKDSPAVETYEYVYDQHGNWTREITRQMPGNRVTVAERDIKY